MGERRGRPHLGTAVGYGPLTMESVAARAHTGVAVRYGLTPAQARARARMLGEDYVSSDRVLFERTHARGELDLARIPADVLTLPFDLVRHDVLMTFEPLPAQRIRAIVDELFLPLAAHSMDREAPS